MKIKTFLYPKSVAITLLAIFGIYICVTAAQWQFNRGQSRQAENVRVKQLLTQSPVSLNDIKNVYLVKSKTENLEIIGVLRSFDEKESTTGSLIALPAPKVGRIQISKLDENFSSPRFEMYLQLTSDLGDSPIPAALPTFSDGPHYAYSFQWSFFVLLILGGRILIGREELRSKLSSVQL